MSGTNLLASTLNRTSASLAKRTAVGQTVHTSADDQTTYLLVHRKSSSAPEVHARCDDLVIVTASNDRLGAGTRETSARAPP